MRCAGVGDKSGNTGRGEKRLGRAWCRDVEGREGAVLVYGQGLGEKVGMVIAAGNKTDPEHMLAHAASEPIKPHVGALRFLGSDGFVCEPYGAFVVA